MVHGCMVDTELALRRQQFHVAPAMSALKYITSVDKKKKEKRKKRKRKKSAIIKKNYKKTH